jgi:BirA family biotin operon repressor/biotin-[acetyl-CoA-carboxylase] ligase
VNLIAAPDMTQVEDGAVYPVSVKVSPASTLRSPISQTPRTCVRAVDRQTTYGFALSAQHGWHAARFAKRLPRAFQRKQPGADTVDENGYLVLNTAKGPRNTRRYV